MMMLFEPAEDPVLARTVLPRFPSTRYQGSKRKILGPLASALENIPFDSALDLYSGSGVVTLLLRHMKKHVDANDFQRYNCNTAHLFLQIEDADIRNTPYRNDLADLLNNKPATARECVANNYHGIFFTDKENAEIDRFCQNVKHLDEQRQRLYIHAVGQALMKKRPYNLFHRANLNMRQKDVPRSFGNAVTWETSIFDHAVKAIAELQLFPFFQSAPGGAAFCQNTCDLSPLPTHHDLVYLDPPYLNSKGSGVDYSDFYGFLDGLCDYDLFDQGDASYPHKPIGKKTSDWQHPEKALQQLVDIGKHWSSSILFMSYRSDGCISAEKITEAMSTGGRRTEVHSCGEYKYALSRTSTNEELFLISYPASR
jgi:adenine-specific DNA-methyltransferase